MGCQSLVTADLKMKIRTYLEALYAMSGLIKFFYVYTGRGNESPTLLEADYYLLTFHEYSNFVSEYNEVLVCQQLQQSIGRYTRQFVKRMDNSIPALPNSAKHA